MENKTYEIKQMVAGAIASNPLAKRTAVLKACQWRLRGVNGEFVGLKNLACSFVPESESFIFDGRDNEDSKLATYQAKLGNLIIEIIPQVK